MHKRLGAVGGVLVAFTFVSALGCGDSEKTETNGGVADTVGGRTGHTSTGYAGVVLRVPSAGQSAIAQSAVATTAGGTHSVATGGVSSTTGSSSGDTGGISSSGGVGTVSTGGVSNASGSSSGATGGVSSTAAGTGPVASGGVFATAGAGGNSASAGNSGAAGAAANPKYVLVPGQSLTSLELKVNVHDGFHDPRQDETYTIDIASRTITFKSTVTGASSTPVSATATASQLQLILAAAQLAEYRAQPECLKMAVDGTPFPPTLKTIDGSNQATYSVTNATCASSDHSARGNVITCTAFSKVLGRVQDVVQMGRTSGCMSYW